MLQSLQVKNLALIEKSEVEFSSGLNILTGETGAGKSILIGSINLALGQKASKELLREGAESAYVELVFHISDEGTLGALRDMDVEAEDGLVILSRKITPQRAVGKVNGETVPGSRLKEIASLLIDIHGQHEHQSLLSRKKHLEILDAYAKESLGDKKRELQSAYRAYKKLAEEYENARLNQEEQARELEFLNYEVNEIEAASLSPQEDIELEKEYKRISNGKKILENIGGAYQAIGEDGASELVGRAVREVSAVAEYDDRLSGMLEEIMQIDALIGDLNREFSDYLDDSDFNEERFFEIENRLDLINHLKSKYGNSVEEILAACEKKQARIEILSDYEAYLAKLEKSVDDAREKLDHISKEVSDIRHAKARELTDRVTAVLLELNFLDLVFTMNFDRTKDYTSNGIDDCEFMISTNPGEPVKPLLKIASGGELSRIMLGIKTVLAAEDHVDTLIFDEIDSGISGRTAQKVAERLKQLGREHQVICITHLPQIAAMADTHYLIEKTAENHNTHTRIIELEEDASVGELARMLGGAELTDAVMENAREMKRLASRL